MSSEHVSTSPRCCQRCCQHSALRHLLGAARLTTLLERLQEDEVDRIEADLDAQTRWTPYCTDLALAPGRLLVHGRQHPGKLRVFMPHLAGNALHQTEIDAVAAEDYEGFDCSPGRGDRQIA